MRDQQKSGYAYLDLKEEAQRFDGPVEVSRLVVHDTDAICCEHGARPAVNSVV